MSLKSAALFALVGMILLTVVLALGFIRRNSSSTLVDFAGQIVRDRLPYGG